MISSLLQHVIKFFSLSIFLAANLHADVFDIDGDGKVQSLKDGILFLRVAGGFEGNAIVNGMIGTGSMRTTGEEITEYIEQKRRLFDIDGDGEITSLTDGVLFVRYLADFEGSSLAEGAVSESATRKNGDDIRAYLDQVRKDHFDIDIVFGTGPHVTPAFRKEVRKAADLWQNLLKDGHEHDFRHYAPVARIIDDIEILFKVDTTIDEEGGILAHTVNNGYNTHNGLPVFAIITCDFKDISRLRENGTFIKVLAHEIGHALGFSGLFFRRHNLIRTPNEQTFWGQNAKRNYNHIFNTNQNPQLHSSLGHWQTRGNRGGFGNELMLPYVGNIMALSRITLGALHDLGYRVNYGRADTFNPTIANALTAAGPIPHQLHQSCCNNSDQTLKVLDLPPSQSKVNWINRTGVSALKGKLEKVFGSSGWNAGASSRERLHANGKLEFQAASQSGYLMVGLSGADLDQSYRSIDYAIYLTSSRRVLVYEKGRYKGNFRSYKTGDRFSVSRNNGSISYQMNGATFYTSSTTDHTRSLVADVSIYTNDHAAIENAKISNTK